MLNFLVSALFTIVWWIISWRNIPILSEYAFFPLWFGYVLTLNATSELLYNDSLIRRMRCLFVLLFAASIPLWWFFEWVNSYLRNWHYILPHPISHLHYVIQASIDFSTVVPAVLSTTFLFFCFFKARRVGKTCSIEIYSYWLLISIAIGVVSFYLMQVFPKQTFPLAWIAPFLILEPVLYLIGLPSLLSEIKRGNWTLAISCMSATLFTGFFLGEMWNYYALPKWYYTIPYVGFWKLFEMPIFGYAGYPFFGIVVLSYTFAIFSFLKKDLYAYLN